MASKPEPPPAPPGPLVVRWLDDGTEEAVPDLSDAVRLASGKNAEVILDDSAPIELSSAKPLVISGGRVILRAAGGARPVLRFNLAGAGAGVLVRFDGSLTLEGLTLRSDQPAHPAAVLVRAAGRLRMEHCAVVAEGDRRPATGVLVEGKPSTFEACEFRGFDGAVALDTYANTEAHITGCLFVRRPSPNGPPAWAIGLRVLHARNEKGPRRLEIDHTTTLGAGLLSIRDPDPATPLDVKARRTVVEAPALLGWSGAPAFPVGLSWSGTENRYAIGGARWVIAPGGVPQGAPSLPGDLASWCKAVGAEAGTTAGQPTVPPGSLADAEARPVAELARAPEGFGFDPARVGPGADQDSPESR
jgi:hypothetical protein